MLFISWATNLPRKFLWSLSVIILACSFCFSYTSIFFVAHWGSEASDVDLVFFMGCRFTTGSFLFPNALVYTILVLYCTCIGHSLLVDFCVSSYSNGCTCTTYIYSNTCRVENKINKYNRLLMMLQLWESDYWMLHTTILYLHKYIMLYLYTVSLICICDS